MAEGLGRHGFTVDIFSGPDAGLREPHDAKLAESLGSFDSALSRIHPDVVVGSCGQDALTRDLFVKARGRGIATVPLLRDLRCRDPSVVAAADSILVPTRFLADYYRDAFGAACTVLPPLVDTGWVRAESAGPGYITFIDPTAENGVWAFARIADELGLRRPDIPLLVVEGEADEAALAGCGLDLRIYGTVNLLSNADPRRYWGVTRIALLPSLGWGDRSSIVAQAMINGVPVIGSERAGLPEVLGGAGMVLPLTGRLTSATRMLPTPEEVTPWVEAVIRLWDNPDLYARYSRRALAEARRWAPEVLGPRYIEFFDDLATRRPGTARVGPSSRPVEERISTRVTALATAFPWPCTKPVVETTDAFPGWLGEGTDALLARELSEETRLVIELGAWMGLSTRFIADHAPNATVISIDHWRGSSEHQTRPEYRALLPTLNESFLAQCWTYRNQIIPLRMTTLDGLRTVADFGLAPDLIYVDAEHSYAAVIAELELSRHLFPGAILAGDDYDWDGVRRAVDDFAQRFGLGVEKVGRRGWKLVDRPARGAFIDPPPGRSKAVVLVPHLNGIEWDCEQGLRRLEQDGLRVVRAAGSSAIDMARNLLASDALHDGVEALLFIDADIGFNSHDALRLLARPEPIIAGIYVKKSRRELASLFAEGVTEVIFGQQAEDLYPLKYAATGFLRIRAEVLRRMIEELKLPLCNTRWGRGFWPFFQPLVVPLDGQHSHYLTEDWAFSHRLGQLGITPLADTSIRLWHYGRYCYGWEDAGADPVRYPSYIYRPKKHAED